MLRVDVAKQLGEFSLQASFTSEGRVTGLFGASGAGKTSLINMIAGLLRPDRGTIAIDGETMDDTAARIHVPAHRRRIGYVFQDARLFPHLDVAAKSRLRPAHEPACRRSRAAQARRRPARYRQPAGSPSRPIVRRRAPARRVRPRAVVKTAIAAAGRAAGRRSTRAARWRSCPIWCGCATKPGFPWSMSATTSRNCASSRRRS